MKDNNLGFKVFCIIVKIINFLYSTGILEILLEILLESLDITNEFEILTKVFLGLIFLYIKDS